MKAIGVGAAALPRLSPVGPMPHKDLIITPFPPLVGCWYRVYSGLSISFPLLGCGQSQPRHSNLMASFVLESHCGKVIKV